MGELHTLTLIEGSEPTLGATQTILLPEAHTDLKAGEPVILEDANHNIIGEATVKSVLVKCFAKLAGEFVYPAVHPGMTNLSNALTTLKEKVRGFSQVDAVTLIDARINLLAAPEVAA